MKYCSVCGQELADSASVCTKCGASQSKVGVNTNSATKFCSKCGKKISAVAERCPYCFNETGFRQQKQNTVPGDYRSFAWAFLCFLIPIVGLILYCVWKNEYPERAISCGKGALISVILSIIMILLPTCVGVCSVCQMYGLY